MYWNECISEMWGNNCRKYINCTDLIVENLYGITVDLFAADNIEFTMITNKELIKND